MGELKYGVEVYKEREVRGEFECYATTVVALKIADSGERVKVSPYGVMRYRPQAPKAIMIKILT